MIRHHNRTLKNPAKSRRGATAVEFALVSPIFFLFLFGIAEFGRMVMVQQSLTNAAREGSRKAALSTTTSSASVDDHIRKAMNRVVPAASSGSKVRVSMTPSSLAGISSGTPVNVEVELDYFDVTWLPANLLKLAGNPVLVARATQERE